MNKSVVWSSAVFTMFIGSAAYVGVSTAMTPPAPVAPETSAETTIVVAKPKVKTIKAVHKIAPATVHSAALDERRT